MLSGITCGGRKKPEWPTTDFQWPAVEKGFKDRMAKGVIAGYQVQDVAVNVHFGKYHDVDSSEAAFKTAGSMAFAP